MTLRSVERPLMVEAIGAECLFKHLDAHFEKHNSIDCRI